MKAATIEVVPVYVNSMVLAASSCRIECSSRAIEPQSNVGDTPCRSLVPSNALTWLL